MDEPKRFRKNPVEIEAIQWTGENEGAVKSFVGKILAGVAGEIDGFAAENDWYVVGTSLWVEANTSWLPIEIGEWIIKDSRGFYPCKDDIFQETYSSVKSIKIDFAEGVASPNQIRKKLGLDPQ